MPGTRHGLNNGARSFWTKYEIEKMGYGTQKKRLGADSQLAFGDCALTLAAAVDPVVSPSGTIYSREAIYKYLLAKTKELKKAKAAYKRDVAQEEAAEAEATQKRIRQVCGERVVSRQSHKRMRPRQKNNNRGPRMPTRTAVAAFARLAY
jgi:hypothetical protein